MRARESARLRWRAATMESTRACLTALITANSAPIARSRSRCLRDGPPNGSGMGMLPAGVFIRTGSPFPRASAISNDWSRSFASRSSCVGPGGTSKPDVRPALSLSLTAFAAESARKGSELRLKPTTAPEIGAPAATREAAVVSRVLLALASVAGADALSRRTACNGSRAVVAVAPRGSIRADARAA
jgi:hypothetical protein